MCSHKNRIDSPDRGDSNKYTQYKIFNTKKTKKKKKTLIFSMFAAMGFFPRDSRTSSKQPW